MKFFTLFLALLVAFPSLQAQHNYNSVKINASDIPPAVLETFHQNYPQSEVKQWEKLTRTYEFVTYNKYVAMMVDDGLITRARIKEDGTALTATSYFRGKQRSKLPENIKNYVATNFSELKLVEVEKTLLFEDNSTYYRIFLQKGVEYKYLYLNLAGTLLEDDAIPLKVKEDDAWAQ